MIELICGALTMIAGIGGIIAGYHYYMRRIYADIAHDEADELFRDYAAHCEYRVHTELHTLILDETHEAVRECKD